MKRIVTVDCGDHGIAAATPVFTDGKLDRIDNLRLDGDGNPVILAEVEYQGELFNYFKAAPKYFDDIIKGKNVQVKRSDLMSILFQETVSSIIKYNDSIGQDDQILLLVGCPTSEAWTSEENRKKYEKLIQQATGVAEVRVIPESRAAMFSALADGKGRLISASEGAVVYDFGSSTADCTYMKIGERCLEFSWNLGAREIEKELRKMVSREASEMAFRKGLELVPAENSRLERLLCKSKEQYFNGNVDECLVAYRFNTSAGKKLPVTIDVDEETIAEATESDLSLAVDNTIVPGGWKACCLQFFKSTKREIEKNGQEVREIVLTGGASKMDFVREFALEIFPKDRYTVTCATNPSFSVSRGLVWVGLVDEVEEEIVAIVKKKVTESYDVSVEKLKSLIKENMSQKMYEIVLASVADWAKSSEDESLNDLERRMKQKVEGRKHTINETNRKCVKSWSDGIISKIRSEMETEIKNNFGTVLGQKMEMPESKWKDAVLGLEGISIDTDKLISKIDINSIFTKTLQWAFLLAYVGLGTAVLPGIGTIIGLIIGGFVAVMLDDDDRNKARKAGARNRVKREMEKSKGKEETIQLCNEAIDKTFDDSQITDDSVANDVETIARRAYEIMTLKFEI